MSRENIITAVTETFQAMSEGRWNDDSYILRHTTDDFEWWVLGTTSLSGTFRRKDVVEACKMMINIAKSGITITPRSWIIEGDRAAVEAESYMKLNDGRGYRNQYHFAIEMREGKIRRIREYMDTIQADKYFVPGKS